MVKGASLRRTLVIGGLLALGTIMAACGSGQATPAITQTPAVSNRPAELREMQPINAAYLTITDFNPEIIADGGRFPFDLEFRIKNGSDANVRDMAVTVLGFLPSAFGKSPDYFSRNLGDLLPGKELKVNFPGLNYGRMESENILLNVHIGVTYNVNLQPQSASSYHQLLIKHLIE